MKALTYWLDFGDEEHAIVVKYYVAPKDPDVGIFEPYIEFDEFIWASDPDKWPSDPDRYLTAKDRWLIESECWDREKEDYYG